MPDFQIIDSVELRTRIGDYLNRVRLRGEVIGITQRGRLVGVLIPIEAWEAFQAAQHKGE